MAVPALVPAHFPFNVWLAKQSGIVTVFIKIEPSFLKVFSNTYPGSLKIIFSLSTESSAISLVAETQKLEMG